MIVPLCIIIVQIISIVSSIVIIIIIIMEWLHRSRSDAASLTRFQTGSGRTRFSLKGQKSTTC